MNKLRVSTTDEVPLQASKWLQCQVLLDIQEMQNLFDVLGAFHIVLCSGLCQQGAEEASKEGFLIHYAHYIKSIKDGNIPSMADYRQWFSSVFTKTADALYVIHVNETQSIVRTAKPVIQLQAHHMGYSSIDGKFRSMVFGSDSLSWGIQFSYPQLYQDNATKEVEQTRKSVNFPNTELFNVLQKWMRTHTVPVPFLVDGVAQRLSVRIGKECLSWINCHAQLVHKEIQVYS